jgi:hypothetical protein
MSVQYGGDKITFSDGSTVGNGWSGFKNRIINGAMVVAQRGTSAVTTNLSYPVDRFRCDETLATGAFSAQQDASAPAGFNNSIKWTTTTAGTAGADERVTINHYIEGFNIADFGWGTANAQTVTLSFWVRSSLTGTFSGAFGNSAGDRGYAFTYTINAADTWEYKTITVAGDTTGTWQSGNSAGIRMFFDMGSGSNFKTTAGSWGSGDIRGATGSVSVMGTLNATFYITGVQLEKGSTATSFDYRPYGTELQLCQRYYQDFRNTANNGGGGLTNYMAGDATRMPFLPCLVTMRASPTITPYTSAGTSGSFTQFSAGSSVTATANPNTYNYQGGAGYWQFGSSVSNPVFQYSTFSAEL